MNLIKKIVDQKVPCFFISPHLDDAILSAGGLISHLSQKTKVEIITVFTEVSPRPYTKFCKRFMSDCGYSDADIFFHDRRIEDEVVCKKVKADYRHLGFIDVAWRKKQNPNLIEKLLGTLVPEFLHLYPFGRNFMSGRILEEDKKLIRDIQNTHSLISFQSHSGKRVKRTHPESLFNKNYDSGFIPRIHPEGQAGMTDKNYIIFCPLAIGNHVDHVIVKDICAEIFPLENIIFWTDYPYINWGNTPEEFIKKQKLKSFTWDKNLEKKRELILGYKSQIPALFPKGLPNILPETYYAKI